MKIADIAAKIKTAFAASGGKNSIPETTSTSGAASWAAGFPPETRTPIAAGGVPPAGLDMNGVLYSATNPLKWAQAGGQYPYDSAFATAIGGYPKWAVLQKANGRGFWINLADDNSTNPDSGGANWVDAEQGIYSATAGGTANAITATFTPAVTAWPTSGTVSFLVRATAANTTAVTFTPAPGVLAPVQLTKGAGAALAPGDIAGAGHWLCINYDITTGVAVLANPAMQLATTAETVAGTISTKAVTPAGLAAAFASPPTIGTAGVALNFAGGMTLNASSNLGLGVTPSAWGGATKARAIDIDGWAAFGYNASTASTIVTNNAYKDTSLNWIYKNSNAAGYYEIQQGTHKWNTAPSGTAGNAITFTQAMTLGANGNLLVGATTNTNSSKIVANGVIESTSGGVMFPDGTVQASAAPSVQGAFKNIQASATGTSATVSVTVDEISVEDASNTYRTLRNVSLALSAATAGANGLDTGTVAASTWYSVWVIFNPTTTTTAGLLSLSATAPTMPSGYTMKARVGWIRTDGTANKYPLAFKQVGRNVQYTPGSGLNITLLPTMASGVSGTPGTALSSVAVSAFVPTTAGLIRMKLYGSGSSTMQVSPNPTATYQGGPNVILSPVASVTLQTSADFVLESTNVYYASTTSASGLYCQGWEDNL